MATSYLVVRDVVEATVFYADGWIPIRTGFPWCGEILVVGGVEAVDVSLGRPQYRHDCDQCTFLGRYVNIDTLQRYDLYHCEQGLGAPTVIARYSHEGSEYISGMVFADNGGSPCLLEAKNRALEMGLNCGGVR